MLRFVISFKTQNPLFKRRVTRLFLFFILLLLFAFTTTFSSFVHDHYILTEYILILLGIVIFYYLTVAILVDNEMAFVRMIIRKNIKNKVIEMLSYQQGDENYQTVEKEIEALKKAYLDTEENYYIYLETKLNNKYFTYIGEAYKYRRLHFIYKMNEIPENIEEIYDSNNE